MRRVLVALAISCALLASGCSGTVTGQVLNSTDNSPVPAATVQIGEETATADGDGRFEIPKVKTGEQSVTVTAEGFGDFSDTLTVERGDNSFTVALENGQILGRIKENAEITDRVTKAQVTLAGTRVTSDGARFELTNVPVGEHEITVKLKGHRTARQTVTVEPGENQLEIMLDLTPAESYMRYHQAYVFGRMRAAYGMVHPDVRKRYSYSEFAKQKRETNDTVSIEWAKVGRVKTVSKWTPSYMSKMYRHVALVDRSIRAQFLGMTLTDHTTQHWVDEGGRWYLHFNWREY
jgi:hypothetical protein